MRPIGPARRAASRAYVSRATQIRGLIQEELDRAVKSVSRFCAADPSRSVAATQGGGVFDAVNAVDCPVHRTTAVRPTNVHDFPVPGGVHGTPIRDRSEYERECDGQSNEALRLRGLHETSCVRARHIVCLRTLQSGRWPNSTQYRKIGFQIISALYLTAYLRGNHGVDSSSVTTRCH